MHNDILGFLCFCEFKKLFLLQGTNVSLTRQVSDTPGALGKRGVSQSTVKIAWWLSYLGSKRKYCSVYCQKKLATNLIVLCYSFVFFSGGCEEVNSNGDMHNHSQQRCRLSLSLLMGKKTTETGFIVTNLEKKSKNN